MAKEGNGRREPSPSGGTGRRTHDEIREGGGGRGRCFNDAAGQYRHGKRDVDDDHRQRMLDVSGERTWKKTDGDAVSDDRSHGFYDTVGVHRHGRRDADDDRRQRMLDVSHRQKTRDGDDISDDRSRRQHAHDGHSRRGVDDESYHRRRGSDDMDHSWRRHGVKADGGDFATESQDRQYRHHEGSVRERSPHRRSSHHDKRVGHVEGYSRSGHRGEHGKTDSGNYQRIAGDNSGRDRFATRDAQKSDDALPELFSVHRAKVQSVRPFGVFVRLDGFYKQGLVHLSQLSDHEVTDREDSDEVKIKAIGAVAGEGDQVWVKVISLKDDGGSVKIGCSLKLVSQSTGKDLDPNNLKLDQHQPKANRQEIKKVTLDAIYNVVCTRCGGHGHLKTECYAMADKTYELIPEEEADFTEQHAQLPQPLEVRARPGFGRGRAMVLPAWMTHGSGAAAPQKDSSTDHETKKRKVSELPDKISTVEEAMALIAEVKKSKKDKHRRKEHKKHKKDKKSKRSSKDRSSKKHTG